jgi:hypothetical protein
VAELQRSVEFPLEGVEGRALGVPQRMQNLGVVLERLWRFYEAMHSGKPLQDGDKVLPQMGTALRGAIRPGDSV